MSLLDKRVKELLEGISSSLTRVADGASPKSVHRLRTTIRRTESLVAFTNPDLSRKQRRALKTLAALRKRAGKVRDLDVQMILLGNLANGSIAADRGTLEDLLKGKRSRQAERTSSAARKIQGSKFLAHLDRIGEKAAADSGSVRSLPLQQARQQLSALAAEFSSRQPIEPRLLHEVRIRMKKIRYLAELGEESSEQQRFLQEMKSVQDALGAWHDWEELATVAEKQFGGRVNCPLLLEVRALFAAKYSAATAAVARLFLPYSAAPARKQPKAAASSAAMARRA